MYYKEIQPPEQFSGVNLWKKNQFLKRFDNQKSFLVIESLYNQLCKRLGQQKTFHVMHSGDVE